jgi:hypothetical protein
MSLEMCMELNEHVNIVGQSCVSGRAGKGWDGNLLSCNPLRYAQTLTRD